MFLNYFLTIALLLSTFFALFSASHAEAGNALIGGASAAVSFTLELLGAVCLWSAVMELLERSGAVKALTRLLAPLLRRLFPLSSRAATPAGIRAAQGIARLGEPAKDELCRLVVLNTASIQLIPSTIAAVRAANGAASAFDIMPAVWFSSVVSVAVGLVMAKLLARVWR